MLQPPIHAPPEGDNTGSIGFWAYTVTEELGSGPGFPPPTAPGGPTLTKLSGGQVRIAWTDTSSNEEGFEIQREKKAGGSWVNTTLFSAGANSTQYVDTPGAGTFRYRVRSHNVAGSSVWTDWKTIKN